MGKKEQRIVLASDHSPIRVGDKIFLETIGKKAPRMTIEELAEIVYEGFAKINVRFDKQEEFNKTLIARVDGLDARINNLVIKNNLEE